LKTTRALKNTELSAFIVVIEFLPLTSTYSSDIFAMKYLPSLAVAFLMLDTVRADYASDAESAIKLLQNKWYNTETGLW
jgi:hypothetical protein